MPWTEIKIILTTLAITLLPGWALLSITGYWRKWNVLARWFLAISLGIAFWPILYYLSRAILPMMRIGTNKLIVLLLVFAVIIVWKLKGEWKEQFKFDKADLPVFFVLALTLFTRFVMIEKYPYPSWTDSLHHTLITDLTATTGKLPFTLMPYEATVLNEYHLGLYGLTAPLQLLANIPAHSALLWMAQFLNGICGLGVFLLLDKKVSRTAGLLGLITVGLFSFQPSLYFSWGRFTQLTAQAIMIQSALLFWETIGDWQRTGKLSDKLVWSGILLSAILVSGMALIHFRVVAFALPLFLIIFLWEIIRPAQTWRERKATILTAILMIVLILILISPALVPALSSYLTPKTPVAGELLKDVGNEYYGDFDWLVFQDIGLHRWLVVLAGIGMVAGLFHKKTRMLSITMVLWTAMLLGEGLLYQTGIGSLAFTNLTGIMILAYLPAGMLVGLLAEAIINLGLRFNQNLTPIVVFIAVLAGTIASFDRINDFQEYRYFMSSADEEAMAWVEKNTPPDSTFGINTYYWLQDAAHGSDAGYWLPYFANRKTTTGTMISNLSPEHEANLRMDLDIMDVYEEPESLGVLCELGVDYLYTGQKAPFTGDDFDVIALSELPGTKLISDAKGVQVLEICMGPAE